MDLVLIACFLLSSSSGVSWSSAARLYHPIRQTRWDDLLRCDFRRSYCSWIVEDQSHYDRLIWHLTRTNRGSQTGPSTDHTSLTSTRGGGYYLNLDTKQYRYKPSAAVLASPPISTSSDDACLYFWYFMHGYDVGHLNVWKYEGRGEKRKLFGAFGGLGPRWYKASVPVGFGQNFTLKIEGTYAGSEGLGNIAVDDISFSEKGPCIEDDANKPRFDCDFNNGYCSWNTFGPWVRKHKRSNTFLNLKRNRWGVSIPAFLRSPTISVLDTGACLGISYYVSLPRHDRLTISKVPYGQNLTDDSDALLVLRSRNYRWERTYVSVPGGENFYIVFHVTGGAVSLDNITLSYSGPCLSSVSDTQQLRRYICTFEDNDACLWSQRPLPSLGQWTRNKGPTPTERTGPDMDHTTGNGYYIYLNANVVNKAQLYSPIVHIPSRGACLNFWYHMYGEDVNRLTVWRYKHMEFVEEKRRILLRDFEGNKGDMWIQHNVTIPSGDNVAVVLEAARGYFGTGDIAIDDVILDFDGPCRHETPPTNPEVPDTNSTSPSPANTNTTTNTTASTTTTANEITTTDIQVPTPVIKVTGDIDPALTGSHVLLECGNRSSEASYNWQLDNVSFRYGDDQIWGPQLVLDDIGVQDGNSYRCRMWLKGVAGRFSEPVTITVVEDTAPKPEMEAYGVTDPAAMGSNIMLTCGENMKGVEYNWTFTGQTSTFVSVTKSRFLVLEDVDQSHDGSYRCSVGKDGLYSAMSNPIKVNVVRGKSCQDSFECGGPGYKGTCVQSRCECLDDVLLTDAGCTERPPTPSVDVIPEHTEFDFGENIHLSCKSRKYITQSATFEFRKDGAVLPREIGTDLFHIYTITNVSQQDSGNYTCNILYDKVASHPSKPANIHVTDVADLSCDFEIDTCDWFQTDHPHIGNFHSGDGSFLQVNQSTGKAGQTAMLQSPFIQTATLDVCLSFLYRMQVPEPHSLSVWVYSKALDSPADGPSLGEMVWETVGDGLHAGAWRRHQIDITASGRFSMVFKAQGDVAIDDIGFSYHDECEEAPV